MSKRETATWRTFVPALTSPGHGNPAWHRARGALAAACLAFAAVGRHILVLLHPFGRFATRAPRSHLTHLQQKTCKMHADPDSWEFLFAAVLPVSVTLEYCLGLLDNKDYVNRNTANTEAKAFATVLPTY